MRITIPLTSPADYEKIELTLVLDRSQLLLQLSYPVIPQAIMNDFTMIEAQMEAEICDSNKNNADFISNLQDRIVVKESMLTKKRAPYQEQNFYPPS